MLGDPKQSVQALYCQSTVKPLTEGDINTHYYTHVAVAINSSTHLIGFIEQDADVVALVAHVVRAAANKAREKCIKKPLSTASKGWYSGTRILLQD